VHTVKRAAELTGIAPATLRVWERRYGVVSPVRSPGGYRLYDDGALRRLAAMKGLVDSGWGAAQAAQRVLEEPPGAVVTARPAKPVVGDVTALSRAARDFDAATLDAALDEAFASGGFEEVVDGWLMPSLAELGNGWLARSVTVAGEHFVSATVQRRLAGHFEDAAASAHGPVVLVGLARGSRHEIGVLAFATALRRAGLDVVYLGADLPPEEWLATARARAAVAAVIGVPSPEDVPAVRETVEVLTAATPATAVHLGGRYQSVVGGPARELGHAIGPAARRLSGALGDPV
jgi:methylmalonyl-CoA mutase cobalamin-binding subunit